MDFEGKCAPFQPVTNAGMHARTIEPAATFDLDNVQIKHDILRMIVQYLQENGFSSSAVVVMDEANLKAQEHNSKRAEVKRARRYVLGGDWDTVSELATKFLPRPSQRMFLYMLFKQEYLEMIDRQEYQRAFIFLNKKLKPLQDEANGTSEFSDLCVLLTCKSVHDVKSFRDWSMMVSREKLAALFESTVVFEAGLDTPERRKLPRGRLASLLQQAVAYQMEFSRYHPRVVPKVTSLASDYECFVVPAVIRDTFVGHASNVKCVTFIGEDGTRIASGSSDNTVKIWRTDALSDRRDRYHDQDGAEGGGSDSDSGAESGGRRARSRGRERERGLGSKCSQGFSQEGTDRAAGVAGETARIDTLEAAHRAAERAGDGGGGGGGSAVFGRLPSSLDPLPPAPPPAPSSSSEATSANASGAGGPASAWGTLRGPAFRTVACEAAALGRVCSAEATGVGHAGRVWDVSASRCGRLLASASADGTVKLWELGQLGDAGDGNGGGGRTSRSSGGRSGSSRSCSGDGSSGVRADPLELECSPPQPPPPQSSLRLRPFVELRHRQASERLFVLGSSAPVPPPALVSAAPLAGSGAVVGLNAPAVADYSQGTTVLAAAATLSGHTGDVYSVFFHPGDAHIVTGGYDRTVRLFDVRTGAMMQAFHGHDGLVSRAVTNPHGNLVVSGGKDGSVRFWDIISGVCIRVLAQGLGELSADGAQLLTSGKNGANRLWDVRSERPLARYKGHQNTRTSFIRCCFGAADKVVIGGSEDGDVYLWETDSGRLLHRLRGHRGAVYHTVWSARQSLLASCAHDGLVKTWWWDQHLAGAAAKTSAASAVP